MKKLFIGSVLSVFSAGVFVSCSIQPAWERQEWITSVDSATSAPGAFKTWTNTFTTPSTASSYYTASYLVQTVYENSVEIKQDGISDESKEKLDKSFNYSITKPTYSYESFVNAAAIVVRKKDGSELVFDSDAHEKGYLEPGQTTNSLVIKLKSDQKNSINSDFFVQALDEAESIHFFLKNDVKWVDYQGNPTQYTLKPEDYYYGFKAQRLSDPQYRASVGGSKEIDEEAQKKIPNFDPKSTYFTNTIINWYLLDLFGLDLADLDDENKYIEQYKGKNANFQGQKSVSFYKGASKDKVFFNGFYQKSLLGGMLFPAPSEFIDKRNSDTQTIKDGKPTGRFGETGEALKYGAYWYGEDFKKDQLFVSPYTQLSQETNRETWKINKYYPRTGWKDQLPYVFNKITTLYSKYPSASAFENAKFNSYREQTILAIGFDSLNDSIKNLVSSDQERYGWRLKKAEDKDSLHKWYYSALVPGSLKQNFRAEVGVTFDEKYYGFNDNFAKLNFGASLADIAKGNAKVVENLVSGPSLEFRLIIANAWNLYTTAQSISNSSLPWYNFVAPDNKITSKPDSKTPRDFYQEANTIKLVDQTGEIYYTKNPEDEKKKNFENVNDATKQFQAPQFEMLKARMKALLDDFYAKNNIPADQKVEWTNHSFFVNAGNKEIGAVTNGAKAIMDLDPRLKINVIWPITDRTRRANYLLTRTGGVDFGGWGYDYDGIGSVLDGKIQRNGVGYAMLSAIYAQGPESKIAKSYPHVYRYALGVKDFFDKFAKKGYIREFKDWKDGTNSPDFGAHDQHLAPDLTHFFTGEVKEVPDPNDATKKIMAYKTFVDTINETQKSDQEKVTFDFHAQSAIFNLSYQEEHTDEELIKLSAELSSLLGFGLNDLLNVPSSTPYAFLENPNISIPYANNTYSGYVPPDMISIIPLKEKHQNLTKKGTN
ncbi:OppA family ABC transporter substrate-binding lipoprotein [Mesomycoplasma ovipneumoniae]|uniref:OppA family ABC transporter substrate-binding lipoprotein n=1 Tax=Mesomycoplasma ovipneumoniae TaxID=29562 RepID=UPI0028AE3EA0|nr:hypothetical protein [Mesomycoplasma ovipneumoniae]WNM13913.1 hypothetical protein RNL96_02225 [Mesomycoplasma ovipneumoniae]